MPTITILITGAEGQIGKTLCNYFSSQGIQYIGLNKTQLDITDYKFVKSVLSKLNFNVLINCAAYTNTEEAEDHPTDAFRVNQMGAKHLAEAANAQNATMIQLSTNCVFNGTKQTPYLETDLPDPQSVYGKSKYAGEQAVLTLCKKALILRTSWVFSPYPGHNFVLKILKIAKNQG